MSKIIGTLLPLTALANSQKKNNLFENGQIFVNWLSTTNQQAWQMLPLHPTSALEKSLFVSPYSGFGIGLNPLFVKSQNYPQTNPQFAKDNFDWITDYSLFMALTEHFGSDTWKNWPKAIRNYDPKSVEKWSKKLSKKIDFYTRQQSFLFGEFHSLKISAHQKNIQLIGDVPFYLSLNSPIVWAHQDCFVINRVGNMPFVSGAAGNDQFPRQVWGHPLYKNENLQTLINFWQMRLRFAAKLYDQVRLDSAIRFYTYGKMHPITHAKDTIGRGFGDKLFIPLVGHCQKLKLHVFCEDITGYSLEHLHKAMHRMDVPGVWVFTLILTRRFLANDNSICYTSNHDTETLLGFVKKLTTRERNFIVDILNISNDYKSKQELAFLIRQKLIDTCHKLILPYQDWILDTKRLNTPGTVSSKNWHYTVDLKRLRAP